MKRDEILNRLGYQVPEIKKKRVIVHSDINAEADDQFAIVHHLLTPTEDIRGIIAANYEWRFRTIPSLKEQQGTSMEASYHEGEKLLKLMEIDDVPLYRGAKDQIEDTEHLPESEGADFIIEECMREDDTPLYIALQGTLTDLAVAYLRKPEIADRITAAIWIGGGAYPEGGRESNMQQDIVASQLLFTCPITLWQVPMNAYANCYISFAELMTKVKTCGSVGNYLVERMLSVNDWYGKVPRRMQFPHGEVWSIGDQPTVSLLLESDAGSHYHTEQVSLNIDMTYQPNPNGKEIRVYDSVDKRLMMEDFFAKLELCYKR